MNEDFTEEEEFDELPEGVDAEDDDDDVPEPAPAPRVRPKTRSAPQVAHKAPTPRQPVAAQEPESARYVPFISPKRVGVIDTETKQPLMEDEDTNALLLGLMTKLLNDVDDIKKNL